MRLINLNFVSTPPSSPKSVNRDREICWEMTFLTNLDSLSQSRSRVSQFYHISRSRFLYFVEIFDPEVPQKVLIISRYLNKSWKISTVSIYLNILYKNLDAAKSRLKSLSFKNLDREKKKLNSTWWTFSTVFKSWSQQIEKYRSWLVSTVETSRLRKLWKKSNFFRFFIIFKAELH